MEEKTRRWRKKTVGLALDRIEAGIEPQLELLERHQLDIKQLKEAKNWNGLYGEQLKASTDVKKLKRMIQELDGLRDQMDPEDHQHFAERMRLIKEKVTAQVEAMISCNSNICDPSLIVIDENQLELNANQEELNTKRILIGRENLQLHGENVERRGLLLSWESLKKDLLDLNTTVHKVTSLVMGQRETVQSIESNIEDAQNDVKSGTMILAAIKKGVSPVAGAIVGGLIAGPLGLVLGVKVGLALAGGGMAIGYATGRVSQKLSNPVDLNLSIESGGKDEGEGSLNGNAPGEGEVKEDDNKSGKRR